MSQPKRPIQSDFQPNFWGLALPIIGAAAGALFGGKKKKQTQTTTPKPIYEFGEEERAAMRQQMLDQLKGMQSGMPSDAYWNPQAFAGMFPGGTATAGHATAGHVNENDPIYSLEAPPAWLSGVLSSGKEVIGGATDDAMRLSGDEATRSGASRSSPAFMYMQALMRKNQQKQLADMVRNTKLSWALPAADRRNSMFQFNAGEAGATSRFNAGEAGATNRFNADMNLRSAEFAANYGRQGYKDIFEMLNVMMRPSATGSESSSSSGGGFGDILGGALYGTGTGMDIYNLFGKKTGGKTNYNGMPETGGSFWP